MSLPMLLPDGIELPDGIRLRDNAAGTDVTAELFALTRDIAKNEMDLAWWAAMADIDKTVLQKENDKGWQWAKDIGHLRTHVGKLGHAWAVRAANHIQGGILYQLGSESELDRKLPTLFVPKLATAPWNREWLRKPPMYGGVGSGLLRLAVYHSFRYGMGGRVTLEAYKDERLVKWYKDFGFQLVLTDPDGISVLELTPEAASAYLV